ncbi:MAG TPA: 6-bladed beta-propeller [bacterium]|nr:6-bladed beta-propeller [bacterium]HPR89402.1 6-bladed beta-propeller [bacterium]
MKHRQLILSLALLLEAACSKKQGPYAPQMDTIIDLDEIEKTVETESIPFKVIYHTEWYESDPRFKDQFIPWIRDINEGPDSTLYVFDFSNSRMVQLTKNGEYIRSAGGPGSGPGEFMHANPNWARSDEFIYICDFSGRRLQILNLHCDYLRSVTNVNIGTNRIAIGKNGSLLYPPPFRTIPPVPYMILMHDSLGNEIHKIGALKEDDAVVFTNKIRHSYCIVTNEKSKYVWCVFRMSPVIRKYDYNNNFIEQIRYTSNSIDKLITEGQDRFKKNTDPRLVRETSGMVIVENPSLLENGDLLLPVSGHDNLIVTNDEGHSYIKKKIRVIVQEANGKDNIKESKICLTKLLGRYYGLYDARVILKSE